MNILKNKNTLVWKILCLYKPYIKKISIILVCIIVSSCISMIIPLISKEMMDDGFLTGDFIVVVKLSLLTLGLIVLDQALGMIQSSHQAYLNSIIPYNLSKKAFKHTLKLKIQYFSNVGITELMSNISIDVGNISRITDQSTFYIITSIFRIFGGLIGLLLIDYRLTLLVVAMLPLRYFIVKYLAKLRKRTFEEYMNANQEYSAWYGDTLGGIKEIKLWNLKRIKCGEFVKKQRSIIKSNIKQNIVDRANMMSESVMFQLITSTLYVLGAYMIANKSFTVGGMFAFVSYSASVMAPISAILNIGYSFSGILPSAKRLFDFFDIETEEDYEKNVLLDPKIFKGLIRFENVSFWYNQDETVLDKISFEIKPGQKVAVIGSNGSGKSTLINILLRLYQPNVGNVLIDNEPICKFNLSDYRSLISVVSQEIYLFNTSIEDNIFLTNDSKLKQSNSLIKNKIDSFINQLPEGYNSQIGKNGSKLSGGQRQKIALSRALAKDAKIIIMDEATSSLDYDSEEQINKFICEDCKEKTVIIVTHKYEILKKMDCILLLDKGKLNDFGTHEELLLRNELYKDAILNSKNSSINKIDSIQKVGVI